MSTQGNTGIDITMKSIGEIRSDVKEPSKPGWEKGLISEIVLDSSLVEFTEGLEEFSHIIVIFWMHKISPQRDVPSRIHPRGRQDLPLVGLFATRAPMRPNPIGISVVKLVESQGNVLKVEGLDALDGTPVIDIKSYLPNNQVKDARFPGWVYRL